MSVDFLTSLGSAAPIAASALDLSVSEWAKHLPEWAKQLPEWAKHLSGRAAADDIDLLDMTVPPEVLNVVRPVLGEFNMRVERASKSNSVIKDAKMHFAVNGNFSAYLLHFRKEVLENARWAKEVVGYGYLFQKGDNVRVLSKDCQDFEPTYELAWNLWTGNGIVTEYVQWRHIARLEKLNEAERADLLQIAFRLPRTLKRRSLTQPQDLLNDGPRFDKLVALLAQTGTASGNADVSGYLNNLLIGSLPTDMRTERTVWGAGYAAAAREFLQWLQAKGRRPGPDGYTYLAAVLVTLMDGMGVEGCTLIVETLEQYHLIAEAEPLAQIRKKFLKKGDQ